MDKKTIQSFTDLTVWQEGHPLVVSVYKITKTFPKEEMFSLVNQMRRAAISVTANIAEGFGRKTYKEKVQFYHQASGSLTELKNHFYIARDIGYIDIKQFDTIMKQADITHKLLNGLIRASKQKFENRI